MPLLPLLLSELFKLIILLHPKLILGVLRLLLFGIPLLDSFELHVVYTLFLFGADDFLLDPGILGLQLFELRILLFACFTITLKLSG